MSGLDLHRAAAPLARPFRRRRLAWVVHALALGPTTRVLDVGGVLGDWALAPVAVAPVVLNLTPQGPGSVVGDGCALPFADGAFDVVYANSVIEHLGTPGRQAAFAAECRRVGVRVYVQTPNYWFPVEPHYLTPVVHWLPRAAQRRLLRWASVWGLLGHPTPEAVAAMVAELRLLAPAEVARLFPDCAIRRERVLGLTKSVAAVRSP
jgi:SAM-dependent methyltransferase